MDTVMRKLAVKSLKGEKEMQYQAGRMWVSGVCGTRTEEGQLKAAGNGSELYVSVGEPVSEVMCMVAWKRGLLAPLFYMGFGCSFE